MKIALLVVTISTNALAAPPRNNSPKAPERIREPHVIQRAIKPDSAARNQEKAQDQLENLSKAANRGQRILPDSKAADISNFVLERPRIPTTPFKKKGTPIKLKGNALITEVASDADGKNIFILRFNDSTKGRLEHSVEVFTANGALINKIDLSSNNMTRQTRLVKVGGKVLIEIIDGDRQYLSALDGSPVFFPHQDKLPANMDISYAEKGPFAIHRETKDISDVLTFTNLEAGKQWSTILSTAARAWINPKGDRIVIADSLAQDSYLRVFDREGTLVGVHRLPSHLMGVTQLVLSEDGSKVLIEVLSQRKYPGTAYGIIVLDLNTKAILLDKEVMFSRDVAIQGDRVMLALPREIMEFDLRTGLVTYFLPYSTAGRSAISTITPAGVIRAQNTPQIVEIYR